MKAAWQTGPIESLCDVEYGTRVVQKRDGGKIYPVYGGGGATFFMDHSNREDRMVVSRFGMSEKCTRFVEGKFFLNDSGLTLCAKNSNSLSQRFLNWQTLALNDVIFALGKGSAQKNLDVPAFRHLQISYPSSLPEQQRIVTLLYEAFDSIATAKANAEKNLQNAQAIFKSQREVLLSFKQGWLQAPLADLCDVKHGYAFEGAFFAPEGDYVLLTPGSFFEAGGYRERGEKTKYFVGPIPNDYILESGDLLVAMTEQATGLLGSPLLVPDSNRFLHNQRLGLVTGKADVPWLNDFFFHVFNLERVRHEIHGSASGVKVRHTSPGRIGAVKVAYPTAVLEQRRVIAQLADLSKECEHLEFLFQQKLTALDELKKSLLHRAFSGQL